jgi:3'(2'), 5'-bisphosphate nucleotidase
MVDPLDGTKEFIKRNGEFTVNIALIENGAPILGVIYVPVQKLLYFGMMGTGAYRKTIQDQNDLNAPLMEGAQHLPLSKTEQLTVVGSRSHLSPETEAFIQILEQTYGPSNFASMGSSLKICLVAEGTADIYPRFAPTMEWDTAAGQGIASAAGCICLNATTNQPLVYNKPNLLNDFFIVSNQRFPLP